MSTKPSSTGCPRLRIAGTRKSPWLSLALLFALACANSFFIASANTVENEPLEETPALTWVESTVKRGDTLSGIADSHHISPQELHAIMNSGEQAKRLSRIRPGDKIQFGFDTENRLQRITTRVDEETRLLIERGEEGFVAQTIREPLERRIQFATGVIESSLFEAARASGISQPVVMQMAGLFGWDVDFSLDVRSGDQFSVVYETLYRDGEHIRDSHIIAAEYINRDQSYRAVRYTDPEDRSDYYSPDGQSLRKAFLRSPIEFARVTSGFSLKRKHPVLHTIRAHKGVDYAAKTGTPIRSTGDGKIVHRGRKGGYGRTVIIKTRCTLFNTICPPVELCPESESRHADQTGTSHRLRRQIRTGQRSAPAL